MSEELAAWTTHSYPIKLNPYLLHLAPNRWHKIHEIKISDPFYFKRQKHAGSCFDPKRGLLMLFGSDTHDSKSAEGTMDSTNSPRFFDPTTLTWAQDYPNDDFSTYRTDDANRAVAGHHGKHPWAMHTFGAVVCDTFRDEMVVASSPDHLIPGRFTDQLKNVWYRVKVHPTWIYDLELKKWSYLDSTPVSFFPFCAVFDSDRNIIIGHKSDGIYELTGEPRQWKLIIANGRVGWANNGVYDSKYKVFIGFGSNKKSNDILVYTPRTRSLIQMRTDGIRPLKGKNNPMAFVPTIGKTVVLVKNSLSLTETWTYDYGNDRWQLIRPAGLPFVLGMNYNLEYDPNHRVLYLVEGGHNNRPTSTWVLKLVSGNY